MKKSQISKLIISGILFTAFTIWTALILFIDVKAAGPNGSAVGFATLNTWFHTISGVHMWLYNITDVLGLLPLGTALGFAIVGAVQLIRRKSLFKVDFDILMLGAHYIAVMLSYLFFEIFIVNFRPVLIEGKLEASYPSSTTMLAISVMIPLIFQVKMRIKGKALKAVAISIISIFSVFMVFARIISGVHWITDIVGGILLSGGLVMLYCALYKICCKK